MEVLLLIAMVFFFLVALFSVVYFVAYILSLAHLCDGGSVFEHATGRPARRQTHPPEHARRTLFH